MHGDPADFDADRTVLKVNVRIAAVGRLKFLVKTGTGRAGWTPIGPFERPSDLECAPMKWAHINMLGEYDFSNENSAMPSESSP